MFSPKNIPSINKIIYNEINVLWLTITQYVSEKIYFISSENIKYKIYQNRHFVYNILFPVMCLFYNVFKVTYFSTLRK
jgi:hypothetical protein